VFTSLGHAKGALISRYRDGATRPQEFSFVRRGIERVFTPCVTEGTEIWIFGSPDGDFSYPDKRIFLGPRGASRPENC
jgi:hypothetical protein